ncbi:peptidoglycan-associated lipoprotein Pal [Novosphingobium umbonatum]
MPSMPSTRTLGTLLLTTTAALSLAACAKKPPVVLPPPPPAPVETPAPPPPPPAPTGPVPGSSADFNANVPTTVLFDLDKFNIDAADQDILKAQAAWLLKYPAKAATIEGHADERGTREYNLALGERRATAAKNYLVSLGVAASRLSTVSYGKERPVDPASTEEAWAKNRRAVTVTID